MLIIIKSCLITYRESYNYVTSDSVHKRQDFMGCINSCCEGDLTCSLVDKDLVQFWQFKKRTSALPKKTAVSITGKQADGNTWVLSQHLQINGREGMVIDTTQSAYIWLGHLRRGRGIAPNNSAIMIPGELGTDGLHSLIEVLHMIMRHNFPASLMVLGCVCMALHYHTIVDTNGECPAPFVCGDVGTGKSVALRAALSMFGVHKSRFYSHGTREKCLLLLSQSTFPVGIDD